MIHRIGNLLDIIDIAVERILIQRETLTLLRYLMKDTRIQENEDKLFGYVEKIDEWMTPIKVATHASVYQYLMNNIYVNHVWIDRRTWSCDGVTGIQWSAHSYKSNLGIQQYLKEEEKET